MNQSNLIGDESVLSEEILEAAIKLMESWSHSGGFWYASEVVKRWREDPNFDWVGVKILDSKWGEAWKRAAALDGEARTFALETLAEKVEALTTQE